MFLSMTDFLPGCLSAVIIKCFMIGVSVWWVYLAPQNIPRAISVLTLGNKVILYCILWSLSTMFTVPGQGKTGDLVGPCGKVDISQQSFQTPSTGLRHPFSNRCPNWLCHRSRQTVNLVLKWQHFVCKKTALIISSVSFWPLTLLSPSPIKTKLNRDGILFITRGGRASRVE